MGRRVRAGVSWNLAGAVATNVMRVVVIAVLGRALTSADFGIVAAAVSVNAILYNLRDIGVGTALVQRKELLPAHVTTAFAFSTALGLAVTMLLVVAGPTIADLYGIPDSASVLRVLAGGFALQGISTTSRMLAQRAMRFRSIAIIETLSFALGSIASMVFALLDFGPWALVIGYLVEEVLLTSLYLITQPTQWSLSIDRARLRELLDFGGKQTFGLTAAIVGNNGDNFVVGRYLGKNELGYYARAYNLIVLPTAVFTAVVGSVLFPAFAKVQDDRNRLAENFRRVAFLNALVLLPLSAVLIVAAPEAIEVLMGRGWDRAVLPFQILCVSMLFRTSQRLGTIVASAAGAVGAIAIAYTLYAAIIVGGALLSVRWGIAGVATTTAIGLFLCTVMTNYPALRVSGLPTARLVRAHLPGLLIAWLVAAATWPAMHALRATSAPTAMRLAAAGALATLVSCFVIVVGIRGGNNDFRWLRAEIDRFRHRT